MRIMKGVTLVATVVLALVAQGGAAGSVATSVYTVPSTTDEPGLSTGLILKKGRSVTVTAIGTVCYLGSSCVGPDGDPAFITTNPGFVLPGSTVALVGRVGSGPWVEVGSGPTKLSGKGELVFAVNDIFFPDNTGSFQVTVSYGNSGVSRTCWPGWGYGDDNHEHCGPPGQNKKTGQSSQPTQGSSSEHGKSEEKGTPNK